MKCTWQFFTAFLFLLGICIPSFAQTDKSDVIVLPKNMPAPEGAKKIGTLTFGNNSTQMRCDYEAEIDAAKIKAGKMGGNIIKITQLIAPSFVGKCYRMKADIYNGNTGPYETLRVSEKQTDTADKIPHATLYIYRLPDTTAFAMGYELHQDNDSVICKVRGRSHRIIHLYKNGDTKFWGKIESERSITINVKLGETYYLRCGTEQGHVLGVPVFQLVDNKTGAAEYKKLTQGKKDLDESYLDEVH